MFHFHKWEYLFDGSPWRRCKKCRQVQVGGYFGNWRKVDCMTDSDFDRYLEKNRLKELSQ